MANPVREWVERTVDAVSGVFSLEPDPNASEADNVENVISETGVVAGLIACLQPLPLADVLVLAPLHVKLTLHVGRIKGFEVTHARALDIVREVAGAASLALASQAVIGVVGKLLPPIRPVLTFPLNYAATYAIGKAIDYYFDCLRDGTIPSAAGMRAVFDEQFAVGKERGQAFDVDTVKSRAEALRARVRARDPDLVTTTRLAPEGDAPARLQPKAAAPAGDPPERRKIRITLDDVAAAGSAGEAPGAAGSAPEAAAPAPEMADAPAASGDAEAGPPSVEKTFGPVAGPPELEIGFRKPPKTMGAGPPPPDRPAEGLLGRLERLVDLHRQGALSDDEFARAKERLLGG